jgi:methylaspartate ammonia-lyase
MKLDPGMHIDMHLDFYGKIGVINPEESPAMAGVVAGAEAEFHWMSLKT